MNQNGKMAQYGSIVGKQWEERPEGAQLINNLVERLKCDRSKGKSSVKHTANKTLTSDKEAFSILSNRTYKEAIEGYFDVVIVFDDTQIIVAINRCVAEEVTKSCQVEQAVA